MRKAFTLVEVLVSVTIISIVVLGLLNSNATNSKLSKNLSNKYAQKSEFSIILLNANENFHGKNKNLYDFVREKFKIKNDDLRSWLKDKKVLYTDKKFSSIKLLELGKEEFEDIDRENLLDITFNISKVSAMSKNANNSGFTFNLQ